MRSLDPEILRLRIVPEPPVPVEHLDDVHERGGLVIHAKIVQLPGQATPGMLESFHSTLFAHLPGIRQAAYAGIGISQSPSKFLLGNGPMNG